MKPWFIVNTVKLLLSSVRAGVMHQVKKLCEPDVIDLSAKKSESTASAAAVGDATSAAVGADASSASLTSADKHAPDTAAASATAGVPDGNKQTSTVAPSGSSPRM